MEWDVNFAGQAAVTIVTTTTAYQVSCSIFEIVSNLVCERSTITNQKQQPATQPQ